MMSTEPTALVAKGTLTNWVGVTTVMALGSGVRQVWLPDWHHPERAQQFASQRPEIAVSQAGSPAAEAHLRQALGELAEFFAGERRAFSVTLAPQGTAFYRKVWAAVAEVPYGQTATYLDIARAVGAPDAVRAVGTANGANPLAPLVPCHRIVGSDGSLTGYGPGLPLKHRLLLMEDALPAPDESVAEWVARVAPNQPALVVGLRASLTACRLTCARLRRHIDRVPVLFTDLAAAQAANYQPCTTCRPDKAMLAMERLF